MGIRNAFPAFVLALVVSISKEEYNKPKKAILKSLNFRSRRWLAGLALLVGSMCTAASDLPDPEEWQLGAEVYFWGASIGGSSATGSDIDISIDNLLDDLDMAIMGAFGARKGKWMLAADVIYLDVSQKDDGQVTLPVGSGVNVSTEVDVKLKGWIVTPTVRYNLIDNEKGSLNLLGGARYLWLDAKLKADISGPLQTRQAKVSDSGGVWDGVVGVNGHIDLNEKWYLPYYADVGAGQSDFTWQAFAGVGYRFKKLDALLGYRYMDWDFDDNEVFDDLNLSGAFVGVKFWF